DVAAKQWERPPLGSVKNMVLAFQERMTDKVARTFKQDLILSQPAQKLRTCRQGLNASNLAIRQNNRTLLLLGIQQRQRQTSSVGGNLGFHDCKAVGGGYSL